MKALHQITFTREKVLEFQRAYNQAVSEKKEQFQFEGHDILTSYAYYMLEYLRMRFEIKDEDDDEKS